jgi:hypothetical protein
MGVACLAADLIVIEHEERELSGSGKGYKG